MSSGALREEVIGRLLIVRDRHSTAGRIVPGSDSIGGAVARLIGQGLLGWAKPGPLDGHCRSAENGRNRLSEDDIGKFTEALVNDPNASSLSILAYLSQRYDLGEELLVRMREMIGRRAFASEEVRLDERIGRLIDAGLVAAAQLDEELATVIASTAVGMTHRAHSNSETVDILQALLTASAAFQREDAWAECLERQLADMASRLPAGEPSRTLLTHLQELKKALKLQLGIHIRAEALASAAN
jgi:hypothetical protein